MVIAIALTSTLAWLQMPKDIFPEFNLPTIYVAQAYGGMDPAQMEGYLVYFFEYHFLYLTGIEHVESKSIQGAALMKLQFHPGTNMSQAMAETVAYVNRARSFMPPGTVPPLITRFDAGHAFYHRNARRRTQSRAAIAIDIARSFRAAAFRWQRAQHRRQFETGAPEVLSHVPR